MTVSATSTATADATGTGITVGVTGDAAPTTFESKEASLRTFLKSKPRNGKVTAELATLLTEHSKLTSNDALRTEARELARRSIEVAPHRPFGYVALSVASTQHEERMQALHDAIQRSQEHMIPRTGFWIRLFIEPRDEDARRCNGRLSKTSSNHPSRKQISTQEYDIYKTIKAGLLEIFETLSEMDAAQKEFVGKYEYRLGLFFRKLEPSVINRPRSQRHFEKCIAYGCKNSEIAKFWLGTMMGSIGIAGGGTGNDVDGAIQKCPAEYVVGLYSTFAANFDELLVEKLNYQTPTKLRELLDETMQGSTITAAQALDLGCGTGLSGLAFAEVVSDHLVGIDLSPEMIAKAKEKRCYDELQVGDVVDALSGRTRYDLIFACDVFVYIGDLDATFEGAARSLTPPHAVFCFSTELMQESAVDERPFKLHANARFAHKRSYLETLASRHGFTVLAMKRSTIRKNGGKPVAGLLAILALAPQ